jgi:hypothetical protein
MALVIALNAVLCLGVIVMVVSPLVWAVFTQERDWQKAATAASATRARRTAARRRGRSARYTPAPTPAH